MDPKFIGNDEYFTGIYSGLAPLVPALKALDVYALAKVWGPRSATMTTGSVSTAVQATVGALLKATMGALDYQLEGGIQFGKRRLTPMMAAPVNRGVMAFNIDGEFGVTLAPGLRLAGYGAYVTGEDGSGKETRHRRRNEREEERPCKAPAGSIASHSRDDRSKPRPVEPHDREDGAELDEDLEGLGPGVGPAHQVSGQYQVAGGRDRDEFGDSLYQSQQQCLELRRQPGEPVIHARSSV